MAEKEYIKLILKNNGQIAGNQVSYSDLGFLHTPSGDTYYTTGWSNAHRGQLFCKGSGVVGNVIKHIQLPFDTTMPVPGPNRAVTAGMKLAGVTTLSTSCDCNHERELNGEKRLMELLIAFNAGGGCTIFPTQNNILNGNLYLQSDVNNNAVTCSIYTFNNSNKVSLWEATINTYYTPASVDVCFTKKMGFLTIQFTARISAEDAEAHPETGYNYNYYEHRFTDAEIAKSPVLERMSNAYSDFILQSGQEHLWIKGWTNSGSGGSDHVTTWASLFDYNLDLNGSAFDPDFN